VQVLGLAERGARRAGSSEATRVVPDRKVVPGQLGELGIPHAAVKVAGMEQDDGVPGARPFVEEGRAGYLNAAGISVERGKRSWLWSAGGEEESNEKGGERERKSHANSIGG
jgi:hypothetical protein